jgi:hypothetical protein
LFSGFARRLGRPRGEANHGNRGTSVDPVQGGEEKDRHQRQDYDDLDSLGDGE